MPFMTTTAAQLLTTFYPAIGPVQTIDAPPRSGFSGAAVYRVTAGPQTYALRRWPAVMDASRLRELHDLLGSIASSGMTVVPVPILTASLTSIATPAGSLWQLEPWLPGRADFWERSTSSRLDAACRTLAHWHVAALRAAHLKSHEWFRVIRQTPSPTIVDRSRSMRDYLAGSLERIELGLMRERSQPLRECGITITTSVRADVSRLLREADELSLLRVDLQPVIRDVWHDHMLFEGDVVTGLIDYGAARTETVATDLSRMLGSLIADARESWDAGLCAYEQVRPLTSNERRLIPWLDRSNVLLSGLTWLRRRYVDGTLDDVPDAVQERLQRIADRCQSGGSGNSEFRIGRDPL